MAPLTQTPSHLRAAVQRRMPDTLFGRLALLLIAAVIVSHVLALTLMFDVPRVAGGVAVFDRAVQFAKHLSQEFDAQLVDDNRRVLSDQGLSQIRDQLTRIYGNMDDRGIAPGSVAALRLFA